MCIQLQIKSALKKATGVEVKKQQVQEDVSFSERNFRKRLIKWYQQNKRDLPWRKTSDPYFIWLSEIILQQTRVNQGLPYYLKFIEVYPAVQHLALADKNQLFKLWQGLGYYRRAENMYKAAGIVVNDYGGIFPNSYDVLQKLPGVGAYTAAAIASIAFGQKVPVVDGNVYRFLSRVFGIETEIGTSGARREFGELMLSLMEKEHPGTFNQAVMEFGALQCVPANPDCGNCIFSNGCFAYNRNVTERFPVVKAKRKKRKLFLYYLVVRWQHQIVLRYRNQDEIWKGLYDFPSLEFEQKQNVEDLLHEIHKNGFIASAKNPAFTFNTKQFKHQLTHIDITARFIFVDVDNKPHIAHSDSLYLVSTDDVTNYPVSRLVERFLEYQHLQKK